MKNQKESFALLRRVDLFSELSREQLQRVVDLAIPRHYPAGSYIFREGDRGETCYVIHSGHARVTRQHHGGRQITLAHLKVGDLFGELAMFDGETRSATVEAITDLKAVALVSADVKQLINRNPDVSARLLSAVVRRLRQANDRITTQSFQTVAGRVAKSILQLSQETSYKRRTGPVTIHVTQSDIAQLAGTSRESVSRFLSSLRGAGVLKCGRGRITIEDPDALARYIY